MNKFPFLFLIAALCLGLVSCGRSEESAPESPAPQSGAESPQSGLPGGSDTSGPQSSASGNAGQSAPAVSEKSGDFDISNPQWCWINWDADGDGTEEELEFKFEDLGDEAPGYVLITLYAESGQQEAWLDRAYGLKRIFSKEDAEGPYLEIWYEMGDYYSHGSEGMCELRLIDGRVSLTGDGF